ncbi:MAG: choice-of-anchor Q domain-containing protein [Chthoniobacterales bacterium]
MKISSFTATILSGVLALVVLVFAAPLAQAFTVTVTNGTDIPTNGTFTLRQAISAAVGGDTVDFAPNLTSITLEGSITIDKSINISGPGSGALAIQRDSAASNFGVLTIRNDNTSISVSISGVSITNGHNTSSGGGIYLAYPATLTITNCSIMNNRSDYSGGGIKNDGGILSINNCVISGNVSPDGGGIFNYGQEDATPPPPNLSIINSTISNNTALDTGGCNSNTCFGGGGLVTMAATVSITNCTISGNRSEVGYGNDCGGGIANYGSHISCTGCAIFNNSALDAGGGICNTYDSGFFTGSLGDITLLNCTVSGNSAVSGTGIYNVGYDMNNDVITLKSCTVASNVTPGGLGAGVVNQLYATLNAFNTIIAKNIRTGGGSADFNGTLTSQGYNLIGNTSNTTITGTTTGNQLNVDPLLGLLQNNGGPTYTMGLQSGSPATDKGSSGGTSNDQRGFNRPVDSPVIPNASGGDGSDIGAFEDQNVCGNQIVTNNNDSGGGSLRAVIAGTCTGATITFAPSVVSPINLTTGEIAIPRPMTITGPGAKLMTVQRSPSASTNFSIFHVSAGGNVTFSGLTITKGNPNHDGGGFYVDSQSTLFLSNAVVTGNFANSAGGIPGNGGGIAVEGTGVPAANFSNTTISGNSATGSAGGIYISSGTLDLNNCTVSGNSAGMNGGGIVPGGTTRLFNDTIANNTAANGGGVRNGGSSVTGRNTIIAKNTASTSNPDFAGTLTSEGYNLIGNTTGTVITGTTTGNILNVNPLLGPLQDNGGPTPTLALLTGSPAIDQGSGFGVTFVDQRGASRPFDFPNIANASGGNGSDIGAFEVRPFTALSAVSRKIQGAGTFDFNLPLIGSAGIECRTGGATNNHQIVFTFANSVTYNSAALSAGTGSVSSASGNGTTAITVNLTGVSNAQRITVTLLGVSDGTNAGDVSVPMGVLLGDTNGNGTVSASDIGQTKSFSGQPLDATNFRADVNLSGSINASDIGLVKAMAGTVLPP